MSKPIKRQMGSRTIPKWEVGQDAREFSDVRYETAEGMAKITINRPQVRNAFRPETLFELERAFTFARDDEKVGVIILTGKEMKLSALAEIFQFAAMMDISEVMRLAKKALED